VTNKIVVTATELILNNIKTNELNFNCSTIINNGPVMCLTSIVQCNSLTGSGKIESNKFIGIISDGMLNIESDSVEIDTQKVTGNIVANNVLLTSSDSLTANNLEVNSPSLVVNTRNYSYFAVTCKLNVNLLSITSKRTVSIHMPIDIKRLYINSVVFGWVSVGWGNKKNNILEDCTIITDHLSLNCSLNCGGNLSFKYNTFKGYDYPIVVNGNADTPVFIDTIQVNGKYSTSLVLEHSCPIKSFGELYLTLPMSEILFDIIAEKGVTFVGKDLVFGGKEKQIKIEAREGNISFETNKLWIRNAKVYSKYELKLSYNTVVGEEVIHREKCIDANYNHCHNSWVCNSNDNNPSGCVWITHYYHGGLSRIQMSFPMAKSNETSIVCGILKCNILVLDCVEVFVLGNMFVKNLTMNGSKVSVTGILNAGMINCQIKSNVYVCPWHHNWSWFCNGLKPDNPRFYYQYTTHSELKVQGNCIAEDITNFSSIIHIGGNYVGKPVNNKQFSMYGMYSGHKAEITNVSPSIQSPTTTIGGVAEMKTDMPWELEGVMQGNKMLITFDNGRIGSLANYRRVTPKFQQFFDFAAKGLKLSSLFEDIVDHIYLRQPLYPISINVQFDPAVIITPTGFRLALPSEKFMLHYLEEIDQLSTVFVEQLQRSCLDMTTTNNIDAYILGRKNAYNFFISQKAIANVDVEEIKFMILYRSSNNTLTPVSWVSPSYNVHNDGLYCEELELNANFLHNIAVIEGKESNKVLVKHVKNEKANYNYTVYVTNTYNKKGTWYRNGKSHSDTVAINVSEAQHGTGEIRGGKLLLENDIIECINGAKIKSDTIEWDVNNFIANPGVTSSIVRSEAHGKKTHIIEHGVSHTIIPCLITTKNGMRGRIGNVRVKSTMFMALKNDIRLRSKFISMFTPIYSNFGGTTMSDSTITRRTIQTALPCAVIASDGDIDIVFEKLEGTSPIFRGNNILLDGEKNISGLILKETITTEKTSDQLFSTVITTTSQEMPIAYRTTFEAKQNIQLLKKNILDGVYINCNEAVIENANLGIVSNTMNWRSQTISEQPLLKVDMGAEGWQEVQLNPIIKANKLTINGIATNLTFDGELIGKLERVFRNPTSWQRQWCHKEQVISDEFLIVANIACGILTCGASTIMSAVITAVISVAITSFARTGDIRQVIKDTTSDYSLKSYLVTAISSGILQNLNTNSHLVRFGATNLTNAGLNTIIQKEHFDIGDITKNTLIQTVAATTANYIGVNVKNYILHKVCHAMLGGTIAYLKGDKVVDGMASGVLSEVLMQSGLFKDINYARLATVTILTMLKCNPSTVNFVAENALIHNYMFTSISDDWEQQKEYIIELEQECLSYMPVTGAIVKYGTEAIEICEGRQTIKGATFNILFAFVGGKVVALVGNKAYLFSKHILDHMNIKPISDFTQAQIHNIARRYKEVVYRVKKTTTKVLVKTAKKLTSMTTDYMVVRKDECSRESSKQINEMKLQVGRTILFENDVCDMGY
jgi:hypothetical protein